MLYPLVSPSRPSNNKMLSLCKPKHSDLYTPKLHTVTEVSRQHQGVPVVPQVEKLQTQLTSKGKENSQGPEPNLDNFPMLGSVLVHKNTPLRNSSQLVKRADHNVNQRANKDKHPDMVGAPRHSSDLLSLEYQEGE